MSETKSVYVTRAPKGAESRFTRIMNTALQDDRLSLRARGLMALVLSMPPTWEHAVERLAKRTLEGEDAVRGALRELVALGYAEIRKSRVQGGRLISRWYFNECPPDAIKPDSAPPDAILAGAGQPESGQPGSGKTSPSETTIAETTVIETKEDKRRSNIPPLSPVGGKVAVKSAMQLRVEALVKRSASTPMSAKELASWKRALPALQSTTEDDWAYIEAFYALPQSDTFSRRSVLPLLNNWSGEIDRARGYRRKGSTRDLIESAQVAIDLGYQPGM